MKMTLKCSNCGIETDITIPHDVEVIACPCCGSSVDELELDESDE